MDEDIFLTTVVKQFYSGNLVKWQILPSDNCNQIYHLYLADGQSWVLRIFSGDSQSVFALARILSLLAQQGYTAEQIVHSIQNNDAVVSYEDMLLLVTRFVEGIPVDYSTSALHLLGKALGKLHALHIEETSTLPKAEMLPAPELAYAHSELIKVVDSVPKTLQRYYDILTEAILTLDRCENAPLVLIHNDCHPGNAIRTSFDTVLLIDWLGAGLGPAVIDVGFLLASCEVPFQGIAPLDIDGECLSSIIDGYCQHHTLAPVELDLLPDAIRFRTLIYGAVSFANAIRRYEAKPYESEWWWMRYARADEIAMRARKCFERYS